MALSRSLPHSFSCLLSPTPPRAVAQTDRSLLSNQLLVQFQNIQIVIPKQQHNARPLWAGPRTRGSQRSSCTTTSDVDRNFARGAARSGVEVVGTSKEKGRTLSAAAEQEKVSGEVLILKESEDNLRSRRGGRRRSRINPEFPSPTGDTELSISEEALEKRKPSRRGRKPKSEAESSISPALEDRSREEFPTLQEPEAQDTELRSGIPERNSARRGRRKRVGVVDCAAGTSVRESTVLEVDTKWEANSGAAAASPSARTDPRGGSKVSTHAGHESETQSFNDHFRETTSQASPGPRHSGESSKDESGVRINGMTHSALGRRFRTNKTGLKGESKDGVSDSDHGEVKDNARAAEGTADEGEEESLNQDIVEPVRRSVGKRRRQRKRKVNGEEEGRKESPLEVELEVEDSVSDAEYDFQSLSWTSVHFKVQADLGHDQRLYVVGANPELGAWDLSSALPLFKCEDEGCDSRWENTIKVPQGMMLEYKYFTEEEGPASPDFERKFGPDSQFFIPHEGGQGVGLQVIRDTWIPDIPTKLPSLSWGSRWWEQIDSSDLATSAVDFQTYVDASKDTYVLEAEHYEADTASKDLEQENLQNSGKLVGVPVAGVEKASYRLGPDEWLKRKIRKKVLPREEPWLLESMFMAQRDDVIRKKAEDKSKESEAIREGREGIEIEPKKEQPVQVEILINSPHCTMQRMAILEDGKLVELHLEPVNTRVQVGNVYLGVVRQLLPGMSGVFVDIGGFQLALLDITRNQYPYTFPDLCHPSGDFSNSSLLDDADDDPEEENSDDDEVEGEFEEEEEEADGSEEDDEDDNDDDDDDDDGEDMEEGEGDHYDGEESIHGDGSEDSLLWDETDGEGGSSENITHSDTIQKVNEGISVHPLVRSDASGPGPITVNFGRKLKKWRKLEEGMQIIVQVKKEALGKKGPRLTAFPSLAGRFWVLVPRGRTVGVSRRITGPERRRLRQLAKELQPTNFGLTVRTEALGHNRDELSKDLTRLMETWKGILELAASSSVAAADGGSEDAAPVLLHRAMGQTLTIVRDFFNSKVHRMVIDSPQCYQEVTSYLQEVAPQLSDRVELYTGKMPIFDTFNVESEADRLSSKRVNLPNGGYLVLEETEALVSIDVNGGTGMLAHDISQGEAILEVNLAAARQIATELRLRDIGGIIVVDFIDMDDPKDEKLVYEEMRRAVQRDRSTLNLSEISEFGLMELTRKRVRPSVTLTISEPCSHCNGIGRVEAHEATLSKIERALRRLLAARPRQAEASSDTSKWPQFLLRVEPVMGEYLRGRKRKRITQLSAALKVWIVLKICIEFSSSYFQVIEQVRGTNERRPNGAGHSKSGQQNVGTGGLLGKRVWNGKRRRNFGHQVFKRGSSS